MKRLVATLLTVAALTLTLCACSLGNIPDNGGNDEDNGAVAMYGVVTHIGELNNTCIFFPESGHMTVPRLKGGASSPEYNVGDVIRVVFTPGEYGIPVMESFPGQFGIEADSLTSRHTNAELSYVDGKWYFGEKAPSGVELTESETVNYFNVEKNEIYCVATVKSLNDGRYTVELDSSVNMTEFLERFFYGALELRK